MSQFEPSEALEAIFRALAEVNNYLASTEPWRENDPATLLKIIAYAIEGLRRASILLQPFIPDSASALLDRLAVPQKTREWSDAVEWKDVDNVTNLLRHMQGGGDSSPVFAALRPEKPIETKASAARRQRQSKERKNHK